MRLALLVLFSLVAAPSVQPARILSVIPTISKSHYLAGRRIILELARQGHEVVSISPFEEKNPPKTFTWISIDVKSVFDVFPELALELNEKLNFFDGQKRLWKFVNLISEHITGLPKIKRFIDEDHSHFDLIIAEEFLQEVFYSFAYKYKAPLVLLSTFGAGHYINEYMGNSLELSYVPHEFSELYGDLSIFDRAKNLVYTAYDLVARRHYSLEFQNGLARKVFKDVTGLPHVAELERNASLILLNSHFSLSMVRPFLPNIVEIGGVHIEDLKPLDKQFKDILDEASQGAILFSLGSMVDLATLPKTFVEEILKALGHLKQEVLLRWGSDEALPLKFKNIHNFKWLPQNEILAHPKTLAFVTHGGLHSAQEAIYHGVPTVCIPFYGDQPLNCKKSEQIGFGIHIQNATASNLHNSLQTVLKDPAYRNVATQLSRRFKDRPMSALNTAVFWIEYVLRHDGADFLKGPKRNLYWFQNYFVDVFAGLMVGLWVLMKLVKGFLGLVFKKRVAMIDVKKRN